MAKLVWDEAGKRIYETGVKNGVLYLQSDDGTYPKGVAWNGLTSVEESPSGADATALWADDDKYLTMYSKEEFGATITAYTYPAEFEKCDGSDSLAEGVVIGQQNRVAFGLCYKTTLGNDIKGNDYGYKLHLVYGLKASPSSKSYSTINDSPEAIEFSWEVKSTPVNVTGHNATSTLVIDSTKVKAEKLAILNDKLFGSESEEATLLTPDEVLTIIGAAA